MYAYLFTFISVTPASFARRDSSRGRGAINTKLRAKPGKHFRQFFITFEPNLVTVEHISKLELEFRTAADCLIRRRPQERCCRRWCVGCGCGDGDCHCHPIGRAQSGRQQALPGGTVPSIIPPPCARVDGKSVILGK